MKKKDKDKTKYKCIKKLKKILKISLGRIKIFKIDIKVNIKINNKNKKNIIFIS